jgi:hypothetical protein
MNDREAIFGTVIGCAEDRDGRQEDNCTSWDNAGVNAGPLGVVFERNEMNVRLSPRKAVRDHGIEVVRQVSGNPMVCLHCLHIR